MTTLDVENVTQKLENLGKSQLNWNNLPAEMKLLCIKEMDFKARTGLRGSSKTERRLVDSLGKYKFDLVGFQMGVGQSGMKILFEAKNNNEVLGNQCLKNIKAPNKTEEQNFQKDVGCIKQVLACDIATLEVTCFGKDKQGLCKDALINGPFWSIEKLVLRIEPRNDLFIAILKHCDEKKLTDIKFIDISGLEETIFDIPQVFNAKKIHVKNPYNETRIKPAMKWLEPNRRRPEAGKVLEVGRFSPSVLEIVHKLEGSTVRRHPTKKAFRVTTSDPSLHIWIFKSPHDKCLQMFIVPSDSEDPDFEIIDVMRLEEAPPNYESSDDFTDSDESFGYNDW